MAKIAYILLCHKDPISIIKQAKRITDAGDFVSIHFDKRAKRKDYLAIRNAFEKNSQVTFAKKRYKCGWGEWSLVLATLSALKAANAAFPLATHFYMLSGDCMPIKSAQYVHHYLDENDFDFIESFDFFKSFWIKTGMKNDRLIYRHFFNERKNKWLFYKSLELQRRLGLSRKTPSGLDMYIGSQWWCLRRKTVESILNFCDERPDVLRFFSTTWIPDETFFQTLVRHLVSSDSIKSRTLTFLIFSDYGMPATFYNDHYDFLVSQDYLFARKISPDAKRLKDELGRLYNSDKRSFAVSNTGHGTYRFLTNSGRAGKRFAPRFWEIESTLGHNRELYIIVCKKWHVAKRLIDKLNNHTSLKMFGYIFNENVNGLPDLGGIISTHEKKSRHRRSFMRMLYDYFKTNRLLFCLDPSELKLLQDFGADRSTLRILEIECQYTDKFLMGHAKRVGLISDRTSVDSIAKLLPSLRRALYSESEAIKDKYFENYSNIVEGASSSRNAEALASFLGLELQAVQEAVNIKELFSD